MVPDPFSELSHHCQRSPSAWQAALRGTKFDSCQPANAYCLSNFVATKQSHPRVLYLRVHESDRSILMAGSIPLSIHRFHQKHSRKPAAVFFLLLSLAAIGPVLQNPGETLLVRDNRVLTVPLFNTWTLWWNSVSARELFKGYWNAPIFFPSKEAFAFSEPQPATLVVAPVIWLGGSPVLAYNIYFVISLILNGLLAWLILIQRRCSPFQALIGGGMMIWLPISLRQFEVLQLVPVWPILWTWHSLDRHRRAPCLRSAATLATATIVTFASSVHHGLFGMVALAFAGWSQISSTGDRRFWLFTLIWLAP